MLVILSVCVCASTSPGFNGGRRRGCRSRGRHRDQRRQQPDAVSTEELQPSRTPGACRLHLVLGGVLLHQVSSTRRRVKRLAHTPACLQARVRRRRTDSPVNGVDLHVGTSCAELLLLPRLNYSEPQNTRHHEPKSTFGYRRQCSDCWKLSVVLRCLCVLNSDSCKSQRSYFVK